MTEYTCLEHMARPLDEAELEAARADQTVVCSANLACTELIAFAVCWRYTDRPGGQEWMRAVLVCGPHVQAFADHHGIDLATAGPDGSEVRG